MPSNKIIIFKFYSPIFRCINFVEICDVNSFSERDNVISEDFVEGETEISFDRFAF